jgi:mRNA interferase MazF
LTTNPDPRRGEVWLVGFDPTRGAEMRKTRPAVVVSSDALPRLPLRLVAPLTAWRPSFAGSVAHVKISPTKGNGLTQEDAADVLQLRGVDRQRFIKRLGVLRPVDMEEIAAAIAVVVEFQ